MSSKPLNRQSLKLLFGDGTRPNEKNFGSLIDSMLNKADDGIAKNFSDGLTLAPSGSESDRVISFKQNIQDSKPLWSIDLLNEKEHKGLGFVDGSDTQADQFALFLQQGGHIGVGTNAPRVNLDVAGTMGSHMRIGTYVIGTVPANGAWHRIKFPQTKLSGYHAFEIMAQVGSKGTGRHALLHALALTTFGRSRHRIRRTQAHYGWWWNKISIRWRGDTDDYWLELKTRTKYPEGTQIKYHITKLWDNEMMTLFEDRNDNKKKDGANN